MELSITSDYAKDTGDPSAYLRRIADAGFTRVHWCHHWNTDFLYSRHEIDQLRQWLSDFGLRILDLHGSVGPEKNWASPHEYRRLAGVELVRNRVEMTAFLGGRVTILHVPGGPVGEALRRSLDELEKFVAGHGVRIAVENGDFDTIRQLLADYGPDYLGLCYDSGHGNIGGAGGLDNLESLKDRLASVHLHDNDGTADQHRLPFTGTVDWPRLARAMAASAYTGCVSMEVGMANSDIEDETAFLKGAFEAGVRIAGMIDAVKGEG